ncbi:DNA mismatch repair protein Msh3-like isoform X1 [Biomphalaria glabrata]|uniref:DNA mismatch repair protein MSH3 n=2 Tax=Biomphalaria glabrata TaxID=6526 RepID=A0A9W2ZGX0_BIOGL|nr:DNA mismatch repair protein Msh3-like isoform X1 [Biomphalaria glabrata]XP_055874198.1 DNA mismatch repair protein Msh3-like isoform X1 [Biomphalaria glabrata]XP_055874208.1 DNA mismatch repair protein Msh3-like isoform X1 [Biomphalaria glabrata]XP_055874214.1 DNA mismatch repair protein Msh3-like isoform X1 [Biomphalaria glabrata]
MLRKETDKTRLRSMSKSVIKSKFFSESTANANELKKHKRKNITNESNDHVLQKNHSVLDLPIEVNRQKTKIDDSEPDEFSDDDPAIKKFCFDRHGESSKDPCTSGSMRKHAKIELDSTTPNTSTLDSSEQLSFRRNVSDIDRRKGSSSLVKYTPLELQFLEIKNQYSDAILFVECGYKYRFFGEDAEIASKVLKIMCNPDHNMMTASIPVHRLPIHIHRMVSAGYKVGVVKQIETQYLKAAGDNKGGPFSRKLASLYTKSTLVGQDVTCLNEAGANSSSLPNQYLMCVCEQNLKQQEKQIGLVCVDPSTGDVIYDEFFDGNLYKELETRISHLQPAEILLSSDSSEGIRNFIVKVVETSSTAEDKVRVEFVSQEVVSPSKVYDIINEFYRQDQNCLQSVLNLSKPVITCLATLCVYLKDFHLDRILRVTSNFHQFSQRAHYLHLNSQSVKNLELLQNTWDGTEKGSLFWLLNQTSTAFGARLLRKWILQPLLDVKKIQERLDAIEEIVGGSLELFCKVKEVFKKVPDLEKGLNSVFQQRCSPQEFFSLLQSFEKIRDVTLDLEKCVVSSLLHSTLSTIYTTLHDVKTYKNNINQLAVRDNDITSLFLNTEQYPLIHECKKKISDICLCLNDHLADVRGILKLPALQYATVFKLEYLIEVKQSHIKSVPTDWIFINSTNAVSRFHTPFIAEKYCRLKELKEELVIHTNVAWQELLQQFSSHYIRYKQAVSELATLDCLLSLANVASQDSFCKPKLVDGPAHIDIIDGRHPIIDTLKQGQNQYVPNSTHLHSSGLRVQVLSGPNMGGKSSYLRQVALIVIMAQMGSYVPAASVSIGIVDSIFISMGSADKLYSCQSTFMVELLEVSDVLAQVTDRSLVILDELGRGTSTHDGVAIAYATLEHLIKDHKCLLVFVTHFPMLFKLCELYPQSVINSYMAVQYNEDNADSDAAITFLYELTEGSAAKSYGLNVARLASIPDCILNLAHRKAQELENQMSSKVQFGQLFGAEARNLKSLLEDQHKGNTSHSIFK